MELEFNRKEKIVGTFVICILILLLATVIVIGRGKDWFKTYATFYTFFDQSYELESGTPVKLFNTDIGKVKDIDLVGDKVKISLAISQEYRSRIQSNVRATVESPSFFGTQHIAIIPGRIDAPLIEEEGIIPSRKKKSVSDYLEEFQVEKTAKMVIETIQQISKIVETMRDPYGPLFTALESANLSMKSIEKITQGIERGEGTVGMLLKSREMLEQIRGSLDQVSTILENFSRTSEKSSAVVDQVQTNLETLDKIETGILDRVPNIQRIVDDIETAVQDLKKVLASLEKSSLDFPQMTRSATRGIDEARDTLENIDKVVRSIQQNFLIRSNLPPVSGGRNVDAGMRR